MSNKILLGDCLELMAEIESGSIDLVLTDPPYNIARDSNFHTMGRAGLDFGDWDKNADILSYITDCFRVLKRGGSFVAFNDWKNLGDIARFAERCGFETKDMIRWEKANPMPRNVNRRYVTDYECAAWFVKPGAKWTFNKIDRGYQRPKFVKPIQTGLHPTQKNLSLMEDLVTIHSNPNDIVLDCFCGSGTTLLAARNLNRRFIGIERDREYYSICQKRLSDSGTSSGQLFTNIPISVK